jgi:hypothetical protein
MHPVDNTNTSLFSSINLIISDIQALRGWVGTKVFGVEQGGTGATNTAVARLNLGLGTVITRWGNTNIPQGAPPGTSVLLKGQLHTAHVSHQGMKGECVAPMQNTEDRGQDQGSYAAHLSPTATGDTNALPSDIPPYRVVTCAQLFVPAITTLLSGTASCPQGWSTVYKGYLLGAHYTHPGGAKEAMCVASGANFDPSIPEPS